MIDINAFTSFTHIFKYLVPFPVTIVTTSTVDLDIIYNETHSNLQALVVLWLLWLLLEVAAVDLGTIVSP